MLLKFGPVIANDLAQTTTQLNWFLECPLLNCLLGPAMTNEVSHSDMLLGSTNAGKSTQANWALVCHHTGGNRVYQFVLQAMHLMES